MFQACPELANWNTPIMHSRAAMLLDESATRTFFMGRIIPYLAERWQIFLLFWSIHGPPLPVPAESHWALFVFHPI